MPYVSGESLRDRLQRETQLPVERAVVIATEIADALAYAHGQGVIHRDIKPENILLAGSHALVADFGIARAVRQTDGERLTDTGLAVGTAEYMSPEQASGGTVDGRSDVFSLGCVLYEMLAGEPPFKGPTKYAISARRFDETAVPSVRTPRPTVSAQLDGVIAKALATVPADRFPSATAFAAALAAADVTELPVSAVPDSRLSLPKAKVRRRALPSAAVLATAVLLGSAVLVGPRLSRLTNRPGGARTLAVLPFESVGDTADAYFAQGIGNAVRAKLTKIGGITVIASTSSNEYRETSKPVAQIARELGVNYLLTASVEPSPTAGRVRITPQLVEVRAGEAPRSRWGQQLEASTTDVFEVQSEIARQVAQTLGLKVGDSVARELDARPTTSLEAYDTFLRGEAASERLTSLMPASLRRAIAAYERAVTIDTSFVSAWARLAGANAFLYYETEPEPVTGESARQAAERAMLLEPNGAEAHQAMAQYYYYVLMDMPRALVEDSIAVALAPGNAELLNALALDEFSLGRLEAARAHFEESARLDPRSSMAASTLGYLYLTTRRYPDAERAYDRALELAPDNLSWREFRAMVALAQSDVRGARAVLRAAPKEIDEATLIAYFGWYADLMWMLDDSQQRLLLTLPASAFDGDRAAWALVRMQTYAIRGDLGRARVYADTAYREYARALRRAPNNAQRHALAGLALAYLGRHSEAIHEGRRAIELLPVSRSIADGAYLQHQLVRIYIIAGQPEKALDQLETLLEVPYILSPGWLRIDPAFDPLRGNPRFERLVERKM
jgi:serine/threonine-protein kinase